MKANYAKSKRFLIYILAPWNSTSGRDIMVRKGTIAQGAVMCSAYAMNYLLSSHVCIY